jgi:PKD repeat protein
VAQRINQNGTLVDIAPFPVMPGFGPTEVSALGDTFLIIARQLIANNPELIQPFVSRVNGTTGAVLDPNGITVGPSFCVSVSVTTVGTRWLAVFRSNVNHDEEIGTTYGSFVNADGTKGNAFAVYGPSTAPGNGIVEVAVASDGTNALTLQSAPLTSTSETDLVGVIVNGDGTHRAAVNLTPWLGNQYNPKVAWNGTHYVVVYQDQINRFALFTLDQLDARSDLFGLRVTADGAKVDPMGFVFSASPSAEGWPNVTAGNGLTLLTGAVMLNQRFDAYRIGYQIRGTGGNQWPVAVATANTSGGDIPLAVNFSSVGTTDLDGTVASYLWDFGDSTTSTQPSPQHTYTTPGKYVVTLTVTDDIGARTSETVSIDASAPNQLPVAKFVVTPATGKAPLNVTLTSDGSYDPDGAVGNRHWTFSDGGDYWGNTAFHTFSRPGTFKVTLTVFDNENATGSSSQNVVVTQ